MAKRTLENCRIIKKGVRIGVGGPEQRNGKCNGYARAWYDDEPSEACKRCKLHTMYEEYNDE